MHMSNFTASNKIVDNINTTVYTSNHTVEVLSSFLFFGEPPIDKKIFPVNKYTYLLTGNISYKGNLITRQFCNHLQSM